MSELLERNQRHRSVSRNDPVSEGSCHCWTGQESSIQCCEDQQVAKELIIFSFLLDAISIDRHTHTLDICITPLLIAPSIIYFPVKGFSEVELHAAERRPCDRVVDP